MNELKYQSDKTNNLVFGSIVQFECERYIIKQALYVITNLLYRFF